MDGRERLSRGAKREIFGWIGGDMEKRKTGEDRDVVACDKQVCTSFRVETT